MAPCKVQDRLAGKQAEGGSRRQADARALEALYDTYGLTLYRFVLRIVRHRADAEDILQEVFARVLQKAHLLDDEHLGNWLVTVARNLAYDHLRSRGTLLSRQVPLRDDHALSAGADDGLICRESAQRVASAVKSLRPRQKKVIELAYYYGLSQSQIALMMNQPLGTVKGRTRAAMLQLHTMLEGRR